MGALVQHVASHQRDHDVEVEDHETHHHHQPQRECDRRRGRRVAQRSEHAFSDAEPAVDIGPALRPDRDESHQHRHEAHTIQKEGERHAEGRDEQSGDGRADDAGAVHDHRVERDRVGQIGSADEIRDVRLAGGDVDRAAETVDRREDHDVPVLDSTAPHERREHERLQLHGGLADEQDLSLGKAVAQDPSDGGKQQDRRELKRAHEAELQRRVREIQHEPGLRHALHPRPDLRDQLADPEQPEVSMPQGTQTHRPSRRREPCDPFGGFRSLGH